MKAKPVQPRAVPRSAAAAVRAARQGEEERPHRAREGPGVTGREPIFSAHPAVLARTEAVHFTCEALGMLVDGTMRADDFEMVLGAHLDTHHDEAEQAGDGSCSRSATRCRGSASWPPCSASSSPCSTWTASPRRSATTSPSRSSAPSSASCCPMAMSSHSPRTWRARRTPSPASCSASRTASWRSPVAPRLSSPSRSRAT